MPPPNPNGVLILVFVSSGELVKSLGPQLVRVGGNSRPLSRRGRPSNKGVGFKLAEFRVGEPRPSMWLGKGAVSTVINSYRHAMQDRGAAVPLFSSVNEPLGQIAGASGGRGECVSLAVEFLGGGADVAQVDSVLAKVAGDLLNPK